MSLQPLQFIGVKLEEEVEDEEFEEQNLEEEDDDKYDDEEENGRESEVIEIYSCKYCQFQTKDIHRLDEHILSHDEALLDEYGTDDTEVDTREHEKEPVISQDTPKVSLPYDKDKKSLNVYYVFVCPFPQCNYEHSKRRTMKIHFTDHCKSLEIPITYACSECCYKTRIRTDMPKHFLSHCKSLEVLLYKCSECTFAAKRRYELARHMIAQHCSEEDTPKFDCTECGYSSKRLSDLNKHVILHSNRDRKGIFKCINCDYMTTGKASFTKHVLNSCNFVENGITILADGADQNYELEEDVTLFNNRHENNVSYIGELETSVDKNLLSGQSRRIKLHLKRTREEESEVEVASSKVLVLAVN